LTQPQSIYWCNGSESEEAELIARMLENEELIRLNERTHPNCYLHRSDPSDVARVEHLTYVCTTSRDDAGTNNHWM
jgi:phosphoenolpyruvate carboxykinase (GTP)